MRTTANEKNKSEVNINNNSYLLFERNTQLIFNFIDQFSRGNI
jgi:hypothetical protein